MNRPVDWKAFEYKFSADPRPAFESLAYILFCYEFKQTYGIFRYYNQPYIETQPVDTVNGHKVGFQAKYYDAGTLMSSKEQDLKDAIKGAKNKYVGIDRIIFYINKEFSASSEKDKDKPQYQLYIEKYGADLGSEIQWRGQSHIEKMLAEEELKYVKNLYFNAKDGIDRFHENLINHKNSILKHIHSTIQYTGKEVKIPQDYQKLTDFQESDTQVMIIHGAAGAGKSAIVKDFLEADQNQKEKITLMFTASDLDVKEENLLLQDGNYGLQDLFGLYKNEEHRLCIIDSTEKYCTAKYPEVFGDILSQFLDHGWKILITISTFYKESFCNIYLKNTIYSQQEIPKLKKETLTQINAQYPFVLPTDHKVQDLLCNLFYLNLYLNLEHGSEDENMNVTLFRDAIWNQVIRNDFQQYNNLPVKREAFVQRMVSDMMALETEYGLKAYLTYKYHPVSALQTPVYHLLMTKPQMGMKFVLDLLNYTSEHYQNALLTEGYGECQEIELVFSETEKVKQICSERLWKMYRDTVPGPNVLECVLMALERWLLVVAQNISERELNEYCLFLLKNSNNVAITATVLSVVEAYPEKLFEISCILLRTKEIFYYDTCRWAAEDANAIFFKGYSSGYEMFNKERIASNNLKFRKTTFAEVIINYQIKQGNLSAEEFNSRTSTLYNSIDQTTKTMENWNPTDQYVYYHIDLRRYLENQETEIVEKNGREYLRLKPQMPEELTELRKNTEKKREKIYQNQHIELDVWVHARYQGKKENYQNYTKYEEQPETAYIEMMEILEGKNNTEGIWDLSTAMYTCAVLLRDFREKLSEEAVTCCMEIVRVTVREWLLSEENYILSAAIDALLPELTRQVSCENLSADWDNPMFLLVGLLLDHREDLKMLPSCIADFLWKQDRHAALKVLCAYVNLSPTYQKKRRRHGDEGKLKTFLDENKAYIEQIFNKEITDINEINTDSLEFRCLLPLYELLNKEEEENFSFIINTGKNIWEKIFDKVDEKESRPFTGERGRSYVKWLADYTLTLTPDRQKKLLQSMRPHISMEDTFATWIWEMVACEVEKPRYEAFWNIWNLLQPDIFRKCDEVKELEKRGAVLYFGDRKTFEKLVKSYLLAFEIWADNLTSWDSLKHENADFYRRAAVRIGYHSIVLYSIAYVLNSVGKDTFFKEGVEWLSFIIKNNPHLKKAELPVNTRYFIEEYMSELVKREKVTLRREEHRRKQVLVVLDFLVEKGSEVGFGMREDMV